MMNLRFKKYTYTYKISFRHVNNGSLDHNKPQISLKSQITKTNIRVEYRNALYFL